MTTPLYGGFPFSMFDPVHLGVDENGEHVYVNLAERNMLLGGEPGGKSSGLNLIARTARCPMTANSSWSTATRSSSAPGGTAPGRHHGSQILLCQFSRRRPSPVTYGTCNAAGRITGTSLLDLHGRAGLQLPTPGGEAVRAYQVAQDPGPVLEFCRYVRSLYPSATRIAIVCDNFSPHLSTAKDTRVGTWTKANNVEIAYTPTKSSWLTA